MIYEKMRLINLTRMYRAVLAKGTKVRVSRAVGKDAEKL